MKKFYVYVHVCPNGKRYVGATTRIKPKYRWGKNGEGYKGQPFEEAIRKYGWDNIEHIIIETNLSQDEACRLEIDLIKQYKRFFPRLLRELEFMEYAQAFLAGRSYSSERSPPGPFAGNRGTEESPINEKAGQPRRLPGYFYANMSHNVT